jgi:mannitol/fructose-specific phosphotransferase system IIA component (Ntr-type)
LPFFLALACPPWDDKIFLKVYRDFAEMIQNDWVVDSLLAAKTQQDVLNVLRGYVTS